MSEWKNYRLGEIADITSSKRIFYSEYVSNGVPFYRSKEIIDKSGKREVQTELFISEARFDEINKKFGVPKTNDILLTSVGTLGIPYLVGTGDRFYFKDGNLTWFRNIDNAKVDPKFLFIWLQSKIGKQKLDEVTIGSTQPALTISGLKTIKICLPEVNEQRAIAEVLSSLDDKIDLLHRQNKTLESLSETLFRHWFIEEANSEWETGTLGDLLETLESGSRPKGGIDPDLKEGIPSIGAESVDGLGVYDHSKTKFVTREFFDSMRRGVIREYDVLIYKDGAYVGRKGMFAGGFPFKEFAVNEHVFILRSNGNTNQTYLYFALDQEELSQLNANSAQPGLNQEAMRSFQMVIPPQHKMTDFENVVRPWLVKIFSNCKQIRSLSQMRDSLLPKLMSREVALIGELPAM